MNTTTNPVSIIARLLHLDNHMKFAKLQPTYKNRNRDFTVNQRFEAGNLLYLSSMAHQSHAWRDSEDDEERDAWAKHTKNIDMVRTQLKFGAPCPELLNVISADLDFLTCTVVMCIDDSEKLKNLNSHCSYLSVFLSEAEGKSNCLIA